MKTTVEWVNVADRLPPMWDEQYRGNKEWSQTSDSVLIVIAPTIKDDVHSVHTARYDYDINSWHIMGNVTHWAAIPELPKEITT